MKFFSLLEMSPHHDALNVRHYGLYVSVCPPVHSSMHAYITFWIQRVFQFCQPNVQPNQHARTKIRSVNATICNRQKDNTTSKSLVISFTHFGVMAPKTCVLAGLKGVHYPPKRQLWNLSFFRVEGRQHAVDIFFVLTCCLSSFKPTISRK